MSPTFLHRHVKTCQADLSAWPVRHVNSSPPPLESCPFFIWKNWAGHGIWQVLLNENEFCLVISVVITFIINMFWKDGGFFNARFNSLCSSSGNIRRSQCSLCSKIHLVWLKHLTSLILSSMIWSWSHLISSGIGPTVGFMQYIIHGGQGPCWWITAIWKSWAQTDSCRRRLSPPPLVVSRRWPSHWFLHSLSTLFLVPKWEEEA